MLRRTLCVCGVSRQALRCSALLLSSASRTRKRRVQTSTATSMLAGGGGGRAAAAAAQPMTRELDDVVDDAYLYDDDDDRTYSGDDDALDYGSSNNRNSSNSDAYEHNKPAEDSDDGEFATPSRRTRRTAATTNTPARDARSDDSDNVDVVDDVDDSIVADAARAPVIERGLGGIRVDALAQRTRLRRSTRASSRSAKAAAAATSARLLRPPSAPPAALAAAHAYANDDEADDALSTAAAVAQLAEDADAAAAKEDDDDVAAAAAAMDAPHSVRGSDAATTSMLPVTNPFLGLHDLLARSYRLDPLLSSAAAHELLFARQERASTAFSFLHLRATPALYTQHWASAPQLAAAHAALHAAQRSHAPVPGFTLFNNDLGFDCARVQHSYPLIVAQRLLLFPDALRHFHALCGRDGVACDFFADIDLDAATLANNNNNSSSGRGKSGSGAAAAAASLQREGEVALLEVLNYLEVRLPSIGFTDPFFLVLTNETASAEKVSYHVHARSMTYTKSWLQSSSGDNSSSSEGGDVRRRKGASLRASSKKSKSSKTTADADDADVDGEDDELNDCVRAVEGGDAMAGKGNNSSSSSNKKTNTTKTTATTTTPTSSIVAFQDYRTVKLLADEVNATLGRTVIDEGCYRARGMLRCAFSAKLHSNQDVSKRGKANDPRRRLVPLLHAHDAALQRKLSHMEAVLRTMTDPEILELSFCTRHLDEAECVKAVHAHIRQGTSSHNEDNSSSLRGSAAMSHEQLLRATSRQRFKLLRPRNILGAQAAQAQEYDAYGNAISPFLLEAAKWRRYKGVIAKLHTLPPRAAESYDVWIRVGLALHNFSNEDHVFDEWVRFSLKCPHKYSRDSCRKKWLQFERNPDALNWRRGFNYLNSTIWRQV